MTSFPKRASLPGMLGPRTWACILGATCSPLHTDLWGHGRVFPAWIRELAQTKPSQGSRVQRQNWASPKTLSPGASCQSSPLTPRDPDPTSEQLVRPQSQVCPHLLVTAQREIYPSCGCSFTGQLPLREHLTIVNPFYPGWALHQIYECAATASRGLLLLGTHVLTACENRGA